MQMERHGSHRDERIDWCPSNKGLPNQPRKYFPVMFLTDGRPIFNQIIICTRFQEIVRVMGFNEARRAWRSPDKLQPNRRVFEMWNDTLLDAFVPGLYLNVDEQLLAFRGRCPFRQYILYTLDKHGIKIWTVCDSATSYVLKIDIYKGKEPQTLQNSNLGCKVVMHLA